MGKWRADSGPSECSACAAVLGRSIGIFLEFFPRFLKRHGLPSVAISAKFHNGSVVRVSHATSTRFPATGPGAASGDATAKAPDSESGTAQARSLTPDELNARLGVRLQRLLRPLRIRFGIFDIQVEEGAITVHPSPSFRSEELRSLQRLLTQICEASPECPIAAAGAIERPAICREMRLLRRREGNHRGKDMHVS
jgi:hypothetical protein